MAAFVDIPQEDGTILRRRVADPFVYVVDVFANERWRKVRGPEGGPWSLCSHAERIAAGRQAARRRTSSTEGLPHRVRAVRRLDLSGEAGDRS